MSKFGKGIIVTFICTVIFMIAIVFFIQFSGTNEAMSFNNGEIVDPEENFSTYEIGTPEFGFINEIQPFEQISSNESITIYKNNNNEYIFFINMNKPPVFVNEVVAGPHDVYQDGQIIDLPSSLNASARKVLNNLYNNRMKVEKYLIGDDNKTVIVNGPDKDGTLGHILKKEYNIQGSDDIMYTFFSTNILIITIQNDADEIDSISTYHRTSEN